jgi:hypothetical protein
VVVTRAPGHSQIRHNAKKETTEKVMTTNRLPSHKTGQWRPQAAILAVAATTALGLAAIPALEMIMSPMHTTSGLARTLTPGTVACAIAACTAAPAALASTSPTPGRPSPASSGPRNLPHLPPGWYKHPPLPGPAHTALASGLAAGQITLIAAAVLAAALLTLWARAARRRAPATHT